MYKSPLELIFTDISHQIAKQIDTDCYQAVVQYVPNVDKGELIRALQYDRQQYEKGYADGKRDAEADLVRCKECKHFKRLCEDSNVFMCLYTSGLNTTNPDNFCSYGERREGE